MLKKILKWTVIGLFVLFVVAQFFPAARTNPEIVRDIDAPEDVKSILRRACYDCHSHETAWPWYSRVAPISWWVVDHVEHGRGDLNFSDWPLLDFEEQEHMLEEIEHEVADREMPLTSYTLIHRSARLSDDDRQKLVEWAEAGSGSGSDDHSDSDSH
ncbi:MAG: heme-binding domain-containing protein [bacterium]|nr:heme-binding domain-containing protein [bacterium]